MSYDDVCRIWERFDELTFDCSMEALRAIIVEESRALFLPEPERSSPFAGESTNDVLVFLCSDADGILGLVRVPAERIDARMRADLELMHGCIFAGAADLKRHMWDAAIRIMAALALEMRNVEELAAWGQEEGSPLTVEDLTPLWNLWQGCDVSRWDQLQTGVRGVCAIRRAM